MTGIYKITNKVTGRIYVGQSVDIQRRFAEHRCPKALKLKTVLSRALRKHGVDNFVFEVLQPCEIDQLDNLEQHYIRSLKPEYNMNEGGIGNRGHRLSDSVKLILSDKSKEQWSFMNDEERSHRLKNNLTGPPKGHVVKIETREKLRKANLGKIQSADSKGKRSNKMKKSMIGNKNGNKVVAQVHPCSGSIINIFGSIIEAAKATNISPTGISAVCKGRQETCAGYWWKQPQTCEV